MGRILAIDYGTKRVGAAISDPDRVIASPLEQYQRRTPALDEKHYRDLVAEERVERIVVGLPLHGSGSEGALAHQAREFGARLQQATGVPVTFFDERFTTVLAERILDDQQIKHSRRRALRDRLAAQILLQAYIESGCPEGEQPAQPLDDRPPRSRVPGS